MALSSLMPFVNSCLLKYPIREAPIFHASKSTWIGPMQQSGHVRVVSEHILHADDLYLPK